MTARSAVVMKILFSYIAIVRVRLEPRAEPDGNSRRYCQMMSPVAASSA